MKLLELTVVLAFFSALCSAQVKLTIVHVNDIHSHFEEINEQTGRCHSDDAAAGRCFGGMARMFTAIKELNEERENVLLLNAGDFYQGTIWYTMFKYEPVVEFGNMLNYTAMGLGNHDFDDGSIGLDPFRQQANYPLLAANIDEELAGGLPYLDIAKSHVATVDGVKVGIVGYITVDTPYISSPSPNMEFNNVAIAVRDEARRLKSEEDVDIVIALGHQGYEEDIAFAEQVEEVDLVVGGHSHSFLYPPGQTPPSMDTLRGDYPTYVTQSSGKVVPVVQAYCYTKYLGVLEVNFDANGELSKPVQGVGVSKAEVILLDNSYKMDPTVDSMMDRYREDLEPYYTVIGDTLVDLVTPPGAVESNLGDLLADSYVWGWEGIGPADFGVINNGGIRSNIITGEITGEDVYYVIPFENTLDKCEILGFDFKNQLEDYATGLNATNPSSSDRTFLQISKQLKVVYNVRSDNEMNRVETLEVWDANQGGFVPMDMGKTYNLVLGSWLAGGGSRTYDFPSFCRNIQKGPVDYDVFSAYVPTISPINQGVEGRITFKYPEVEGYGGSGSAIRAACFTLVSTLIFSTLLSL